MSKSFYVRDSVTGSTTFIEPEQAGLSLPVVSSSQVYVMPAPSGGDDAVALNAFFVATPAGAKILGREGTYLLNSGPLILQPQREYDFSRSAFTQTGAATYGKPILTNLASTTSVTATDVATTSGSNVIVSPQLIAAGAAVGQTVRILVAGPGPASHVADLNGKITSIAGNNISLGNDYGNVNAQQTLTNASAYLITRDADLKIKGGTFTRVDTTGVGTNRHITNFRHLDRFEWSGATIYSTSTQITYAITVGDVADWTIEKVRGNVARDGVHIEGNSFRGTVRDVKMTTGDDLVAITARNYDAFMDTDGDVLDITITDIHSALGKGILICGGTGTTVARITVDGFHGKVQANAYPIRIFADSGAPQEAGGVYDDLVFRDVDCLPATGGVRVALVTSTGIRNLTFENLHTDAASTNITTVIELNACSVDNLTVRGLNVQSVPSGTPVFFVSNSAVIGRMSIEGGRAVINNNLITMSLGTISELHIANFRLTSSGAGSVIGASGSTSVLPTAYLSNVRIHNTSWLIDTAITTVLYMSNVEMTSLASGVANIRATGNLRILGGPITSNSATLAVTAGGVVSADAPTLHVDATKLTPQTGDTVYNTNTALAAGVGKVTWDDGSGSITGSNLYTTGTFESGATGYVATAGTAAQSTDFAHSGSNSLKVTSDGTAIFQVYKNSGWPWDGNVITAGRTYLAFAYVRTAATARQWFFTINWYDSSQTVISSSSQVGSVADTSSGWTLVQYSFTAPANAVAYRVILKTTATPANTEVHYIDDISFYLVPAGIFRPSPKSYFASGVTTLSGGVGSAVATAATANSQIRLTTIASGGTVGHPYVSAIQAGSGFTITSTSATDTSTIFWELVTP